MYQNAPLNHAANVLMDLHPSDVGHGMIAAFGNYELPLTLVMKKLAQSEGGTLLDVGANYGYFSLLWASQNAGNRVEAVEASPRNLATVKRNIDKNNLANQITLHALAAGNHEGAVSFDLGPEEQTGWGGITQNATASTVTVPQHRLDSLFADRNFTVLKIDCEGADAWVLEGAEKLLRDKKIKHIFLEENVTRQEQLGIAPKTVFATLERFGYHYEKLCGSKDDFHAWLP